MYIDHTFHISFKDLSFESQQSIRDMLEADLRADEEYMKQVKEDIQEELEAQKHSSWSIYTLRGADEAEYYLIEHALDEKIDDIIKQGFSGQGKIAFSE